MKRLMLNLIVTTLLIAGLILGIILVQRQQQLKSRAAQGSRIEFIGANIVAGKAVSRNVKVKLTYAVTQDASASATPSAIPSPTVTASTSAIITPTPATLISPTPSASPTPSPTPSVTPLPEALNPKAMVLIFNPILEKHGNKKLTEYIGWNDPDTLAQQFINEIKTISRGFVQYTVVSRVEVDGYNRKLNGFDLTDDYYLDKCRKGNDYNCNLIADYRKILTDYDVCGKRNRGEIDELWLFGGPWFGYWESNLAGPNAFWYNSSPTTGTSCTKLLPIMGFSYEVGVDNMLHDVGHRLESTMFYVFGAQAYQFANPWYKFRSIELYTPGKGGCGDTHFPVNAQSGYDYGNPRKVKSSCEDLKNYPNLTGEVKEFGCERWGCSHLGYMRWMLGNMPYSDGRSGSYLNNWWLYLIDPQTYALTVKGVSVVSAQTSLPTHFRLSNTQEGLLQAIEQIFDMNDKEVDWQLTDGSGTKTVYAQFKINNSWGPTLSASIELALSNQIVSTPRPEIASPAPYLGSNEASETASITATTSIHPVTYHQSEGDTNGDGNVNLVDLSLVFSRFHKTEDIAGADINKDGVVNSFDLAIAISILAHAQVLSDI